MKHKKPRRTGYTLKRLLLGIVLAALLGGCIQPESGGPALSDGNSADGADNSFPPALPRQVSSGSTSNARSSSSGSGAAHGSDETQPRSENNTNEPVGQPSLPPTWGPATSEFHPGVLLLSEIGLCTTNFVFLSPDYQKIYVGAAAHCFSAQGYSPCSDSYAGLQIGAEVGFLSDDYRSWDFANASYNLSISGRLAYSSYITMDDVNETDHDACIYNDFALIEIPRTHSLNMTLVIPSFGAVTKLADPDEISLGQTAACYCHSPTWWGQDPLIQKVGVISQGVSHETQQWWYLALYNSPIVWGDSGSPGLVQGTLAAGVLTYFAVNFDEDSPINAYPGIGNAGHTVLATALEYMQVHTGLKVKLAEP